MAALESVADVDQFFVPMPRATSAVRAIQNWDAAALPLRHAIAYPVIHHHSLMAR
jgi:hypothetical protein